MIGHLVACYGAADRYLGMLAATLGESERAEEHFERALELNRRDGRATWLAHTAYEYGRLLLARGPATRDRAEALLGEAAALAERDRHAGAARADPGARRRRAGGRASRRALRRARSQILALVARGLSNREIGRALVDQRAHRRQPHPQHPAQDRLREPHRGRVLRAPARARVGLSGPRYDPPMPLYVIERTFADQLDLTDDDVSLIDEINADEGVRWLFSFLSADRRRTYCLYEAPSADAIMAAARRANVPADAVVEVGAATPSFSDRLRDWANAVQSALSCGSSLDRTKRRADVRGCGSHVHRLFEQSRVCGQLSPAVNVSARSSRLSSLIRVNGAGEPPIQ